MISKIKKVLTGAIATILLTVGVTSTTVGAAAIQQAACQGSELTFNSGTGDPTKPDPNACEYRGQGNAGPNRINNLITDIVNIISVIVGIVAVIMIIYGGFRYMTSGGDSSKVADARNTIIYAIVGLIIVVFAQFIVKFILSRIANGGS